MTKNEAIDRIVDVIVDYCSNDYSVNWDVSVIINKRKYNLGTAASFLESVYDEDDPYYVRYGGRVQYGFVREKDRGVLGLDNDMYYNPFDPCLWNGEGMKEKMLERDRSLFGSFVKEELDKQESKFDGYYDTSCRSEAYTYDEAARLNCLWLEVNE